MDEYLLALVDCTVEIEWVYMDIYRCESWWRKAQRRNARQIG